MLNVLHLKHLLKRKDISLDHVARFAYNRRMKTAHIPDHIKGVLPAKKPHIHGDKGSKMYTTEYISNVACDIVMYRAGGKCQMCGKKADHVHHIDADRTNNEKDNLIAVCRKCHMMVHRYIRKYPDYRAEAGVRPWVK